MSLLDIGGDTGNASANYIPPPKPKTSAWADVGNALTAVPRGIGEAGAQVMGTAADLAASIRRFRDASREELKAQHQPGAPAINYSSELGDSLRDRGREFRPDPETASTAEQILYGFSRGAAKIVAGAVAGGVPGVLAAGAEEAFTQSDELKRQGVDVDTRSKAGLVQGAGLALAALPAAGTTIKSTLALYAAGGPGGFVAQQALTREILQSAGYEKLGLGFDPFDPVGLAVASLIPAGFAAYGFRQAKIAAAVRDLPDLPPRADAAPGAPPTAEPMPSRLSPIADAVRRYPQEVEDAARVLYQAEVRESANPGADMEAANKHADALARAEDQMARGEPVQVADIAPKPSPIAALHGSDAVFDEFQIMPDRNPALFFSEEGAGRKTQAESISEGPFGGQLYRVEIDRGRPFNPYNDPKAAEIFNELFPGRQTMTVEYPDIFIDSPLIKAMKENGYNRVRVYEPSVQTFSEAVTDPSMVRIVSRKDVKGGGDWVDMPPRPQAEAVEAAPVKQMTTAEADFLLSATNPAAAEPGAAFDAAAPARIDEIRLQYPDLMVQMDGGAPMRMDDFLAAAKAEADELAADAPLMKAAAECALTFGL
jgi:hypothetical protein